MATPANPPLTPSNDPFALKRALLAAFSVLAVLTIAKHLAALGVNGTIVFTFAAAWQLYLPVFLTRKLPDSYARLGLTKNGLLGEIALALGLILAIAPFFVLGHHFYATRLLGLTLAAPPAFNFWQSAYLLLNQLFAIALPEELFYRGYLQVALQKKWPPKHSFFGVPIGLAVIITSALFALGHFLGEYNILRFGPFFPALLFSWLRGRRGSIWGATFFHALSNILSAACGAFYH